MAHTASEATCRTPEIQGVLDRLAYRDILLAAWKAAPPTFRAQVLRPPFHADYAEAE